MKRGIGYESSKKHFQKLLVFSIFCAVLGTALIADPGFFTDTIGYIIAGLLTCYGAVMLVIYFTQSSYGFWEQGQKLVGGLLLCAAGVFVFIQPDIIAKVVAIVSGMYMLINGIVNLQGSSRMKKAGYSNWKATGIPALITLAIGIALVLNPLMSVNFAMTVLGICLLTSGIINLINCAVLAHRINKIAKMSGRNDLVIQDKNDRSTDIIDI